MTVHVRVAALAIPAAALVLAAQASAAGGRYTIVGGTEEQRAQIRMALEVSTFDWNIVRDRVVIHITRGTATASSGGHIWLGSAILDLGEFSWGIVQREYARQVDALAFDEHVRAELLRRLGAKAWCRGEAELPRSAYGCERFAATLAWAYWPSPRNVLRPTNSSDASAAMPAAKFRALMERLLGVRDPAGRAP
jgi:hypothetical protein